MRVAWGSHGTGRGWVERRHHQDVRGDERPAGTPPAQATGHAEMEVEATREYIGVGEARGKEE